MATAVIDYLPNTARNSILNFNFNQKFLLTVLSLRMTGVGISFGNTNAYLSVWRGERSEIIANSSGERSTSTLVGHLEGELLTGAPAVQMSSRLPANTVSCLKSMIGRSLEDIQGLTQACKLEQHSDEIIVNFGNVTRKGVSALVKCVFDNLKETADSALGGDNHEAVIAVPLSSSTLFKNKIKKCATAAGFNVVDVVPDPLAALLHHDDNGNGPAPDGFNAVVRIGGYSMSFTIIRVISGMYSVIDHVDTDIGGSLFDKSVGTFLCEDFNRKNRCKVEQNPRSMSKILKAAKSAKHNLSTLNTSECNIESVYEGTDLVTNLSRPRFETLIQNDLNRIKQVIQDKLSEHGDITIGRVILSGGCCKVPKVQSVMSSIFSNSNILGQTPDEEVSLGAACHFGTFSKYQNMKEKIEIGQDGTVSIPVCPTTIAVRIGDTVTEAFAINTPLPCKADVELPEGNVMNIEADGKCLVKATLPASDEKCKISLHLELLEDLSIEGIIKDLSTNERTSFSVPGPAGA